MSKHIPTPVPFEVQAFRGEARILDVLRKDGPMKKRSVQVRCGRLTSGKGTFGQIVSRMVDAGSISVSDDSVLCLVDESIRVFSEPEVAIEPITPTNARIPIIGDLRMYVWDKTGGVCWYCGVQTNPFRDFACDHVVPLISGGTNEIGNLVPCCRRCNSQKGTMLVEQYRNRLGGAIFWFERVEKR